MAFYGGGVCSLCGNLQPRHSITPTLGCSVFVPGQSFSSLLYAPLFRLPRAMALKHLWDLRTKVWFQVGTPLPFHPLGSNVKKRTWCMKTVFHITMEPDPKGTCCLVNWPHLRKLICLLQLSHQPSIKMHPWFVTPG